MVGGEVRHGMTHLVGAPVTSAQAGLEQARPARWPDAWRGLSRARSRGLGAGLDADPLGLEGGQQGGVLVLVLEKVSTSASAATRRTAPRSSAAPAVRDLGGGAVQGLPPGPAGGSPRAEASSCIMRASCPPPTTATTGVLTPPAYLPVPASGTEHRDLAEGAGHDRSGGAGGPRRAATVLPRPPRTVQVLALWAACTAADLLILRLGAADTGATP